MTGVPCLAPAQDAMNPFVPGTWRGQRPATYYGRVDLTRSGGESAAWSVLVKLIEGGVVEERVVKPKLVLEGAGISLVNGKLAVSSWRRRGVCQGPSPQQGAGPRRHPARVSWCAQMSFSSGTPQPSLASG